MYFYRYPGWGIGFRIFMIVLLIAGASFMTRSAFQAGYLQGAAAEGAEITVPYFAPHLKGHYFSPMGGTFLTVLAVFFGGILLIKLISSIVGLVMFNRWRKKAGKDWDPSKAWRYRKFYGHPHHWGPHHYGPWGGYPPNDDPEAESGDAESEPDPES